jgi:4a-hydroxytetrahydrobiopterin dehydratase
MKWILEGDMLVKDFVFDDFMSAMGFMNKVAEIAEKIRHHPNMLIHQYNHVRISLQSHDVKAVTDIDYSLADLIDHIKVK